MKDKIFKLFQETFKDVLKRSIIFILGSICAGILFFTTSRENISSKIEDTIVESLKNDHGKDSSIKKEFFGSVVISGENANSVFWVGTIEEKKPKVQNERVIAVAEIGAPSFWDQITNRQPEWRIVNKVIIPGYDEKEEFDSEDNFDGTKIISTDLEGQQSLIVKTSMLYADRISGGFILFKRIKGKWEVYSPPSPETILKKFLKKDEWLVNDNEEFSVNGKDQTMPLVPLGNYIFYQDKEYGTSDLVFFVVPIIGDEAMMSPHKQAIIAFRLYEDGYKEDFNWNGGKPFITRRPMDEDKFDVQKIIQKGMNN